MNKNIRSSLWALLLYYFTYSRPTCVGIAGYYNYISSSSSSLAQYSGQGRSFTANSGAKAANLPKGRSSTANSGTKVAVIVVMNRCGCFPLLSALHSLFSIWSDLKRSKTIPGVPAWRWGEWIRLTEPSGLHRNSPQGLNISFIRDFDQIRDPEIPITLRSLIIHIYVKYTVSIGLNWSHNLFRQ